MAGMALLGLAFAMQTKFLRRERDHPKMVQEIDVSRVISVAPAKLPALGYVPGSVNILAGFHVAELLDDPRCSSMQAELRNSESGFNLNLLQQWTGLRLEEIEHAVIGAWLEERLLPHGIIVVRMRRPVDVRQLRAHLQANRASEWKGRQYYRYTIGQTGLDAIVAPVDERTLVFALVREDLGQVPPTPKANLDRFGQPMRGDLETLQEGTQAWALGRAANWQNVPALQFSPEIAGALAKLRSFVTTLACDKETTWKLRIDCADHAAALELDVVLARLFVPKPDSSKLRSEITGSLTHTVIGESVQCQAKILGTKP